MASTTVRCGEDTGKLLGDVLDSIDYLRIVCPENILDDVKQAAAIVAPEMELKLATEDIISKI